MGKTAAKITIDSLLQGDDEGLDTLADGVWNITDIPRLSIHKPTYMALDAEEIAEVQAFIEAHGVDNIVVGAAYETDSTILLASRPTEVETWEGSFNHGSSGIVTNCPREIMILAEND